MDRQNLRYNTTIIPIIKNNEKPKKYRYKLKLTSNKKINRKRSDSYKIKVGNLKVSNSCENLLTLGNEKKEEIKKSKSTRGLRKLRRNFKKINKIPSCDIF